MDRSRVVVASAGLAILAAAVPATATAATVRVHPVFYKRVPTKREIVDGNLP